MEVSFWEMGSYFVKLMYKMYFLLCRYIQNSSSVDKMSLGNVFKQNLLVLQPLGEDYTH